MDLGISFAPNSDCIMNRQPRIDSSEPNSVFSLGGTVTLRGEGFTRATDVKAGLLFASVPFVVLDDSRIQVTLPALALGLIPVRVATAVGLDTLLNAITVTLT